MEKIPGWVEKIFTPKVNELIGEVKALNTKVDSLRNETKSELASLRNEMLARFEAADVKIDSLRNETKADIESLRKETKSDIDGLKNEMLIKFEAADAKVESFRNEMISRFEAVDARFDSLEMGIPIMEKMGELEARLAEVEKKLSVHA
ncbi:hypothetical protein ES705_03249 [subsurface metagenome]